MSMAARIAIAVVAALHVYFLVLEMFLWTKPAGLRAFGLTAAQQVPNIPDSMLSDHRSRVRPVYR